MTAARAVGAELVWWPRQLSRLAGAAPRLVAVMGLALVVFGLFEAYALAMLILVVLLGLGLWARLHPQSYRRTVSAPAWQRRKKRRIRRNWTAIMNGCGLSRREQETERVREGNNRVSTREVTRLQVPRLRRLGWCEGDLIATPGLLTGQTVADVDSASEALRSSIGADRIRIVRNRAVTGCEIVWSFGDPLDHAFPAALPDETTALAVSLVPVGREATGAAFGLPVWLHTFVVGATGAGKSSWMWGPLFALAPATRAGLVEIHGIDLKGGMELRMGERLLTRCATTAAEAVVLLEEAAEQMQTRAETLAGKVREHTPTLGE